jgi:hypothetical protein
MSASKKTIINTGNYKIASMVVEIEVPPKHRLEKYDREVQCEIIEANPAG